MCPAVVPHVTANASRASSSGRALMCVLSSIGPLHQTVLIVSTPDGECCVLYSAMADDAAIRLTNFLKLWGESFSPSQVAAELGKTAPFWSDLRHGRKSFGEKLAREIEHKMQLVRLSLDDVDGPKRSPVSADVLSALSQLPIDEQARVESMLRSFLRMNPASAAPNVASRKRQANGK
jgi:hypothetical protein